MPSPFLPMLASLAEPPVVKPGLVYEPKYDGMRAIVEIRGPRGPVSIVSRNGKEKAAQFPEIVGALESLAKRLRGPVILDGEIVAVDRQGTPLGFQHLQGRIHLTAPQDIARAVEDRPAALVIFDLLLDGDEDLRSEPLVARRLRLQERIAPSVKERRWIRLSDIALDDGRKMLAKAHAERWEGLIVKDGHSRYYSGKRTPAWRKMKLLHQQEFVVGGWTAPRLSRQHFGSLLLGYYEGRKLRWAGSVGTGFDQQELERLAGLLRARATPRSPFADDVKTMEPAQWVTPSLVVQVRFTEWTSDGMLRHPVYLGARDDKNAREITRETGQRAEGKGQREGKGTKGKGRHGDGGHRTSGHGAGRGGGRRESTRESGLAGVVDRLHELEDALKDGDLALPNGDVLKVTNLAKLFWPDLKITKGDLLRYYAEVSPLILPAVADRPLVMKRYPNGIEGKAFYQQRHPEAVPAGVRREVLPPDVDPIDEEGPRDRLIGGSLTTLLYMAQLAAISQDPWFSRVDEPRHPDHVAIDLDPGEGVGFARVLDVARWIKDEMDTLGVPGVPKTSGSRGLHIYVPLPGGTTYESGQLLCHLIATIVSSKHPQVATIERMVKRRPRGTVYIDYLQNILGKTLATAYSVRASEYGGVSTPLTWREVERGVDPRDYTIRTALARFRSTGDLWKPLRNHKAVDLDRVLRRAAKI